MSMIEIPAQFSFGRNGDVSISQNFAQWLGRMSNCNVVIQHKRTGGAFGIDQFRLLCDECKAEKYLERLPQAVGSSPDIEEFARAHRHMPAVVPVAEGGRRFRQDD